MGYKQATKAEAQSLRHLFELLHFDSTMPSTIQEGTRKHDS